MTFREHPPECVATRETDFGAQRLPGPAASVHRVDAAPRADYDTSRGGAATMLRRSRRLPGQLVVVLAVLMTACTASSRQMPPTPPAAAAAPVVLATKPPTSVPATAPAPPPTTPVPLAPPTATAAAPSVSQPLYVTNTGSQGLTMRKAPGGDPLGTGRQSRRPVRSSRLPAVFGARSRTRRGARAGSRPSS